MALCQQFCLCDIRMFQIRESRKNIMSMRIRPMVRVNTFFLLVLSMATSFHLSYANQGILGPFNMHRKNSRFASYWQSFHIEVPTHSSVLRFHYLFHSKFEVLALYSIYANVFSLCSAFSCLFFCCRFSVMQLVILWHCWPLGKVGNSIALRHLLPRYMQVCCIRQWTLFSHHFSTSFPSQSNL